MGGDHADDDARARRDMSMRRALRSERGFGVFWLGFCATVLGDAITRTTLIWYVFDLTGSSVSLGWLSFCFTAPVIVGGKDGCELALHLPTRDPGNTTTPRLMVRVGAAESQRREVGPRSGVQPR